MVKTVLLTLLLPTLLLGVVPAIQHPVTDPEGMLNAREKEFIARGLVELRAQKHVQMAVLLVETTNGQPIDDYAEAVFRQWKGGDAGKDNGLLLVIARGDRRSRLEVGYGLESYLPDGEATELLHAQGVLLREGRYGEALTAIVAGVQARMPSDVDLGQPRGARWTFAELRLFFLALVGVALLAGLLLSHCQRVGFRGAILVAAGLVAVVPPAALMAVSRSSQLTPGFLLAAYVPLLALFTWGWTELRGSAVTRGWVLLLFPVVNALVSQLWAQVALTRFMDLFLWMGVASLVSIPVLGLLVFLMRAMANADWGSGSSSSSSSWSSSASSSSSSYDYSSSSSSSSYDSSSSYSSSDSSSSSSDWSGGGGSSGGGGGSDSW